MKKRKWILREVLASERLKTPVYFKGMAAIGPMSTSDLKKAERFVSQRDAMMSPAYSHTLSCYEAEQEPKPR